MSSNFPSHWKTLPFEVAVADVTAGKTKLQGSEYSKSGVLPIIDQGQEFIGGYTDDINYQANVTLPTIIFGDHTRVFKYVDFPFCLGADGTKILEPKVNLDKKFLFHYLKSLNISSAGYSRHYKFLKENVVPIPPLEEQKRIAAILDKADAIRRKRQEAIKLAVEFLRAVFLDMFGDPVENTKGWNTAELRELIHLQGGFAFKSEDFSDSGIPVVKIGNANKAGFTTKDIAFIKPDSSKKLTQYELYPGDLLISLTGTVGKDDYANVTEVTDHYEKYYLNQRVAKISTRSEKITKAYLKLLLAHPKVKSAITKNNRGVRQANLSNNDIYQLNIPVPDSENLFKFDQLIIKLNEIIKKLNKFSKLDDKLFSSLSHKAFYGDL